MQVGPWRCLRLLGELMKSAHRPYVQLHNAVDNDNLFFLSIFFLPGLASVILSYKVAHEPDNVVKHEQGHQNRHKRNCQLPETSPGQSGPRTRKEDDQHTTNQNAPGHSKIR